MTNPGRKRKAGARYPSGDLKRPTADRLNAMAAEQRRKEQQTVLDQPHRRGQGHAWAESPLGRLCLRRGLRQALHDAGSDYAAVVTCWRNAKGIPRASQPACGTGREPDAATVMRWQAEMLELERAMLAHGIEALLAVRTLVLDIADIGLDQDHAAIDGLSAIAIVKGRMKASEHPFAAESMAA